MYTEGAALTRKATALLWRREEGRSAFISPALQPRHPMRQALVPLL